MLLLLLLLLVNYLSEKEIDEEIIRSEKKHSLMLEQKEELEQTRAVRERERERGGCVRGRERESSKRERERGRERGGCVRGREREEVVLEGEVVGGCVILFVDSIV